MRAFEGGVAREAARAFRRAALQLPRGRLLDLGAGTGRQLLALPPAQGQDAIALDLVALPLRRLRHREPTIPALVGDGHRLPFADRVFDAVLAAWVFEALADPEAAALELHRVMRPGAQLLIVSCTEAKGGRRPLRARLVQLALCSGLGAPPEPRTVKDLPGFECLAQTTTDGALFSVVVLRAVQEGCCTRVSAREGA